MRSVLSTLSVSIGLSTRAVILDVVETRKGEARKMIYSHGIKDKCGKRRIYESQDVLILLNFYGIFKVPHIPRVSRAEL